MKLLRDIILFLVVLFGTSTIYKATVFSYNKAIESFSLPDRSNSGKIVYIWKGFAQLNNWIKTVTPPTASIMHPPQINPWEAEGNQFLLRGFLYPRILKLANPQTASEADYLLISQGLSRVIEPKNFSWPYFPVPFSQIYLLDEKREFSVPSFQVNGISLSNKNWLELDQVSSSSVRDILNLNKQKQVFSLSYRQTDYDYWGWSTRQSISSIFAATVSANLINSVSLFACATNGANKICFESSPNQTITRELLSITDIPKRLSDLGENPTTYFISSYGLNFGYFRDNISKTPSGLLKRYVDSNSCHSKESIYSITALYDRLFSCYLKKDKDRFVATLKRLNIISPDRYWFQSLFSPNLVSPLENDSWTLYLLAKQNTDQQESLSLAKKAIYINDKTLEAYNLIGSIFEQRGDLIASTKYYRLAGLGLDPIIEITSAWRKKSDSEHKLQILLKEKLKEPESATRSQELIPIYEALGNSFQIAEERKNIDKELKQLSFSFDDLTPEQLINDRLMVAGGQSIGEIAQEKDNFYVILSHPSHAFHFALPQGARGKPLYADFSLKFTSANKSVPIFCQSPIGGNYFTVSYEKGRIKVNFIINTRFFNKLRAKNFSYESEPISITENSWNKYKVDLDEKLTVSVNGKQVLQIDKVIKLNKNHVYNVGLCPGTKQEPELPITIDSILVKYK